MPPSPPVVMILSWQKDHAPTSPMDPTGRPVYRAVCMRAILGHVDPARAGQLDERVHVARLAGQVHADDCSGIGGKYGFDGPRGDILRVSVYVCEDGCSTRVGDAGRRRNKGARR